MGDATADAEGNIGPTQRKRCHFNWKCQNEMFWHFQTHFLGTLLSNLEGKQMLKYQDFLGDRNSSFQSVRISILRYLPFLPLIFIAWATSCRELGAICSANVNECSSTEFNGATLTYICWELGLPSFGYCLPSFGYLLPPLQPHGTTSYLCLIMWSTSFPIQDPTISLW